MRYQHSSTGTYKPTAPRSTVPRCPNEVLSRSERAILANVAGADSIRLVAPPREVTYDRRLVLLITRGLFLESDA